MVSRLSFLALANEKYDFSEDDLQVNLLSSKTLKDNGIVTDIASSPNNKRYFFRHKMLAEHLAGIYLSMEGFRVPEYTQRLESGDKVLLSDRLGSFHNMVAFAAGVSSVFFRELCKSATEHCIIKGLPDKDTFLHPQDAVLFLETQDPSVAESFARYLLDATIVKDCDEVDLEPSVYEWSAALYFVDSINFQTVCDLFERCYHLKMYQREQRDDDETESHFEEGAFNIETVQKRTRGKYRNYDTLDFQQCGLLFSAATTLMVFHNVRSVVIDDGVAGRNSVFLQLKDVINSFPNVSEMEMRRVTLYSTEHRIGFMKDLLGDLDFSDSDDDAEEEEEERQHPLKSLTFDQIHPNESVVRDMKSLQNVENFQVNSSQMLDDGFDSLAAAIRAAPRMRVFSINNNHLGWSAMVLLKALSTKEDLDELHLSNCALRDSAEPLKMHMENETIAQLRRLRMLDISYNQLTHRQIPVINYFSTASLKVLKLSGNHLGPAAVKVFDNLSKHDNLSDLHMDDCALDSAVEPLQEAVNDDTIGKFHHLKTLHLKTNWLEGGISEIIYYFCTSHITVLHLSENPLGEAAVDLFYILAEMDTVVELFLDNCNLDDAVAGVEAATAANSDSPLPKIQSIQVLNVSDNGLKDDSAPLLAYIVSRKLKSLDMSLNPIGEALLTLLDNLAKFDCVRDLNLKNCDLQSAVDPLRVAMETNSVGRLHKLKHLNISGNFLEFLSKGMPNKTFDKYFATNEKLKTIKK